MRLTLYRKFLLLLVPSFIVLASAGIAVSRQIEVRDSLDDLAARVGTQAGRIVAAVNRHDGAHHPVLAQDLMGSFASEPAVLCAELRDPVRGRLASYPAVVGCTAQVPTATIDLPVGDNDELTMSVGYTADAIAAASRQRTLLLAVIVSAAFLVTLLSASAGFKVIVSRRLARLHAAILRTVEGTQRVRVDAQGRDELGDIMGAYNALVEREQRREAELTCAHNSLQDLSRRDPLTGAFNRRHFQERIKEIDKQCRETGRPGMLALLDIDHFKVINDQHGHQVGDSVLVEIARRLNTEAGEQDIVARWGGEEFLVCLKDAGPGGLDGAAARMLGLIASAPIDTGTPGGAIPVTASIGVVPFPLQAGGEPLSWEDTVALADWGLYRAKRSGRAQATVIAAVALSGGMSEGVTEGEGAEVCLANRVLTVGPHSVGGGFGSCQMAGAGP